MPASPYLEVKRTVDLILLRTVNPREVLGGGTALPLTAAAVVGTVETSAGLPTTADGRAAAVTAATSIATVPSAIASVPSCVSCVRIMFVI